MSQELWTAVDQYLTALLVPSDGALDAALETSQQAGLPAINVAGNQGKLLWLLATIQGASRILEIGTLGGYSTIWLGRALPPEGFLVTLEIDAKHAAIAQSNLARAGLDDRVQVRIGRALDLLPELAAEAMSPFDFVFIDADKQSIPQYFEWALELTQPGSVIVVDNVVRRGAIIDENDSDPNVQGVRRFLERVSLDNRVSATALQTVGSKGYDGFLLARVNPRAE